MIFHETNPMPFSLEWSAPASPVSGAPTAASATESGSMNQHEALCLSIKTGENYANLTVGLGKNVEFIKSMNHAVEVSSRLLQSRLHVSGENVAIPIIRDEDSTDAFIRAHGLKASISWLRAAALDTFDYAYSEIALVPPEENEADRLSLIVYSSFDFDDFAERKRRLRDAMRREEHMDLFGVMGIYQRRMQDHGWEIVSLYSKASAS